MNNASEPTALQSFALPALHDFPPFYTQQVNQDTWQRQRQLWADLLLDCWRHASLHELQIGTALSWRLFNNTKIQRRLKAETLVAIIDALVEKQNALWLDPPNTVISERRALILWRPISEWAQLIYQWADTAGHINGICTVYELVSGDETTNQAFHGLHYEVLDRALTHLVQTKRAQVFQSGGTERGVKFLSL